MAADNVKRFEFRLGKWGLGLFVCGMSLLVFFSFLFGVMVGKDLDAYPEKYSWGIAKQITGTAGLSGNTGGPVIHKTEVAVKDAGKEHPNNENSEYDLSFYETLSKKSNNLRTQQPGNEGAAKIPEEPASPAGERTVEVPAAPSASVPAIGLLPGNKSVPEKKIEKRALAEEKKKEISHRPKNVAASQIEKGKRSVAKLTDEKGIETGSRIAEKKAVHKAEKNIATEKKEKKTEQKLAKNTVVEKIPEYKPAKKNIVEKKVDLKVQKNIATEKKPDKNLDRKEIKKEEKKQKPEGKKYMAQVASYRERGKADQVAGKLKAMGYSPHVVPMDLPGKGRWYRITISGLSSHDKAKEAVVNVEKKIGGSKGFIRPEGE